MIELSGIKKVSIVGAGAWGTSVAIVIAEKYRDIEVSMWAYEKSVVSSIRKSNENKDYLAGRVLPKNITATNSLKESLASANVIIIATPSKIIPDMSLKIKKNLTGEPIIGFLTKGFCRINGEILTISQAFERLVPEYLGKTIAIYGPSHAEEVCEGFHTCLNIGGRDEHDRKLIASFLTSSYLECRDTDDIIGVELGGTLKNPAAIAAGMISVLPKCGDNLSGALISEALKEMIKLGAAFNVRTETLIDISGLGDLVATALSSHSRNRRFGIDIASQIIRKGTPLTLMDRLIIKVRPEMMIERMSRNLHYLAEGAYAIEPLLEFAEIHNISIPVYRSLYEVLLNKKNPSLLVETIKNPARFDEIYSNTKIILKERKKGLEGVNSSVFAGEILAKTNKAVEHLALPENCERLMASLAADAFPLKTAEKNIILNMNKENPGGSIEKLVSIYVDDIIDSFNPGVNYLYRIMLSVIDYLKNAFSGDKPGLNYIERVTDIRSTDNIIYIPLSCTEEESLLFTSMIKKFGYPFPRFGVRRRKKSGMIRRWFMRRAGGYIFSAEKLSNPLYRESLYQYISTMLEHGIPVLFRPDLLQDDEYSIQFFETVIKMMYEHTVEVKIIPITIDSFKTLVSDPIALSDFTKDQTTPRIIAKSLLDRIIKLSSGE